MRTRPLHVAAGLGPDQQTVLCAILAAATLIGVLCTPTTAYDDPEPAPDFSWLIGNWKVKYTDRHLGEVTGYAAVTEALAGGEPHIRYVVKHPQTNQEFELGGTSVKIVRGWLEIKLFGASPSASVNAEGETTAQASADAIIITAEVGATLKATLDSQSVDANVSESSATQQTHLLRFLINPANPATNYLDGRWNIERHWRSGFRGLRNGVRYEKRRTIGALDNIVQTMGDEEIWSRRGPTIDKVTIASMADFGRLTAGRETRDPDQPLTTDVWLRLEGKDLPVQRGEKVRSVVFDDELIKWTAPSSFRPDPKVPGALQIQVQIGEQLKPGHKRFTLDGAPGVWKFDFPGLEPKDIRYMRKLRDDEFQATRKLYPGEVYYIEIEFGPEPFYSERSFQTTGHAGTAPVVYQVTKVPSQPRIFRSKPFILLEQYEGLSAPGKTLDAMWDPNDPASVHTEPGTIVRAKPGSILKTTAADAVRPNGRRVVGPVVIGRNPIAKYKRALATATRLRQMYPERERYEASQWVVGADQGGKRNLQVENLRTYISVPDHAALLLLHEEVSDLLQSYVNRATRALKTIKDVNSDAYKFRKKKQVTWTNQLFEIADNNDDHFLFLYEVSTPDGSDQVDLDEALRTYTPDTFKGATLKEKKENHRNYLLGAVASAEGQAINQAGEALSKFFVIDITEPTVLLQAVGLGYDRVAAAVMQDLVRPSVPANGEPLYPRWVPDLAGRAAVRGIGDLARAVKADELYAGATRLYAMLVLLPALYLVIPAAGAEIVAGTFGAGRAALTALELANMGLVEYEMLEWDQASEAAEIAKGNAVVAGTSAYRMEKARADAALLSALVNGGLAVGVPLFMKAAQIGLRPSKIVLENAADQVARRGLNGVSDETRAAFEYLRGRAEYRAAKKGFDSLTDLERQALGSAYPDGFPPDVAERLGITGAQASTIPPKTPSNLAPLSEQAERAALSTINEPAVGGLRVAAPEQSASPVLRKWYGALEPGGGAATAAKQNAIEAAEEMFLNLTPAQQGRAIEALEILDRLRRTNPALANMDEAVAARMIMLQARGERATAAGLFEALDPEEMVTRVAAWNRASVSPKELAEAANISEMNAQAALGRGDGWASRFEAGRDVHNASTLRFDPQDSTLPLPPKQPSVRPPSAATDAGLSPLAKREQVEGILRGMGMNPAEAELAAIAPAASNLSPREAAAGAAMMRGMSPSKVMEGMNLTPEELRAALNRYHKRFDWEPNRIRRAEMIDNYINGESAGTEALPTIHSRPPTPRPPQGLAPGIDGPVPSNQAVKAQVVKALEDMGVDRATAEGLHLDYLIERVGPNPDAIAAGAARRLGIDPAEAGTILNKRPNQLAGALDQYDEAMLPFMSSSRRAETIGQYLGKEGGTEPVASVMAARSERVDAALRDLGVPRGDPELIWGGLDVESAVVGTAMDESVSASTIMARRGLSAERLAQHTDEYLHYGRGMTDPAERAETVTKFMEGTYKPPDSSWRLPEPRAAVVATEGDIAAALKQLNIEPTVAEVRAFQVSKLAAEDAHAALAGAAMHGRVPPAQLRETFGLTNEQIANKLDVYLASKLGMTDPAKRAEYIATNYFGRLEGPKPNPVQVRAMVEGASDALPPFRPHSTLTRFVPPAQPKVPPRPLQFADNDLVYGPASGGELRLLQQRAKGTLLTDIPVPEGVVWKKFTTQVLDEAALTGRQVHFDLTYVEDVTNILAGQGRWAENVTSVELRYIRDNWNSFAAKPKFYLDGREVPPPWMR